MEPQLVHAGFWRRLAAYIIDMCPLLLLTFVVAYFFFGFDQSLLAYLDNLTDPHARLKFLEERRVANDIALLIWLAYSVLAEASSLQGTLGKRLLGIRVVDQFGRRLTFAKAFWRNVGKILSLIPFALGCLRILWSPTKQAWHDSLAHCYVVRKPNEPIAGNP